MKCASTVLAAIGANVKEPDISEQRQSRGSAGISGHGTSPTRNSDSKLPSQCQRPERFCIFEHGRPPNRALVIVSLEV